MQTTRPMTYNYLLIERSAIEELSRSTKFQSVEFTVAREFIACIQEGNKYHHENLAGIRKDEGLVFIGKTPSSDKSFLLFDWTQCDLLKFEKHHPENVLIVLQKCFRAAIRFWNGMPFTSAERVNHSKLVIFPFKYYPNSKQNKRLVIERQHKASKIIKNGIKRPLLAYKYSDEDVADGSEEVASTLVMEQAGEDLLQIIASIAHTPIKESTTQSSQRSTPLVAVTTCGQMQKNEGFKFMDFDCRYRGLTEHQKSVVDNDDVRCPIRVEGPAGSGKTASLIMRAYKLLENARQRDKEFHILFVVHSESTRFEIEETFRLNIGADSYLLTSGDKSRQSIQITTLLEWCKNFVGFTDEQLIDKDASDSKDFQRLLIHDVYEKHYFKYYQTYSPHLSEGLKSVLHRPCSPSYDALDYMLQHEFSVQIKGRADGSHEKYQKLESIPNGLPVSKEEVFKDKEYIFRIYREYQERLDSISSFDTDDVVIQAIQLLNAPRWRRDRLRLGYDYIIVDEMHLFNANEQYTFRYLTKDINQSAIPICFALDYSQAFGDRGNIQNDYIEIDVAQGAFRKTYQTIFRSSQAITNLCASIISAGTQFFQSSFNNPYGNSATSGFSLREEEISCTPQLFMYNNDEEMIASIGKHIGAVRKKLGSDISSHEIVVVSFINELLNEAIMKEKTGRDFFLLTSRNAVGLSTDVRKKGQLVLSSPHNINGLEFKCVILVGVDEGRVPQTSGTSDISANYLRYTAINQLYLSCSRARYQVIILGNKLHGKSSCLSYALSSGSLQESM